MIGNKIRNIGEEIVMEEKKMVDFQASINKKKKEIEDLEVLKKRLLNIYHIRYKENIGDPEKINNLVNQYCLKDLLEIIAKLTDTNLSYNADMIPLMNLTIWQGVYLFFGDNVSYEGVGPAEVESDKPKDETE